MPTHYSDSKKPKKKVVKMPRPLDKPRKQLTKLQKDYMKVHSKTHSKEHNNYMIKMMKRGFCIQQSHKLAMKNIGK